MRNPTEKITSTIIIKWTALILPLLLLLFPIPAVHSKSDGGEAPGQWHILTKHNFSSQIRFHPHILLIVTVPWCGESRSLVKELSDAITHEWERYDGLKLRLLYRDRERMLADALGATEGIALFYYRQALPYKYRGRLRVQNVLSSVRYAISLLPEEIPLKFLNTPEDLGAFISSTDKALLLHEFCGWTTKLLAKGTKNGTENAAEGYSASSFTEETDATPALQAKETAKLMENGKMECDAGKVVRGIPWFHEFTSVNDSLLLEDENTTHNGAVTCTLEEYQNFEWFLPKFLTVVRDFFLPPERLRFGVIRDRSLLSLLNVEYSGSCFVTSHVAGCPSAPKVVKEVDDLKTVLQTQSSLIMELEDHIPDVQPALPANKPSILLFIDRSSDSLEITEESREALGAFREFALNYQSSHQISRRTDVRPLMSSASSYPAPMSTSKHQGLELFPAYQKIGEKEVSIMIMKEGKHVNVEHLVSDLQGSSLQEILEYVLQRKKQLKLSTLAKDVGFQLLSEDVDIKGIGALLGETETLSGQVSGTPSEGALQGNTDSRKEQTSDVTGELDVEPEVKSKPTVGEFSERDAEKNSVHLSSLSAQSDGNPNKEETNSARDDKVNEETLTGVDEQKWGKSSWGSFFFYDGNYRLLKALTGGSKIPSVVIIDPIQQHHYVLQEHAIFSFSLLSDFLHRFLNGSLSPYQQSEPIALKTREAPSPPFINLDFHEVDSIPRVTAHTFGELVFGNRSDKGSTGEGPNRNVFVLFSNNWCGFCQRMELVVREVYRAIKGYANMLKEGSWSDKTLVTSDDVKKATLKLPLIYLMDCTMNDCSMILKSMAQRELYPSLLLFPAGSKSPMAYEGDIVVSDIFKFLIDSGSLVRGLVREKGVSSPGAEQGGKSLNLQEDSTLSKSSHYEVLLKDRMAKVGIKLNQFTLPSMIHLHETNPQLVVGSMLVATDKLSDAHTFDRSNILIVKVDQIAGYQGLILNKHISWDSLDELDEGLELLKEAPLSFGGPVVKKRRPLVALARKYIKDEYPEVLPNVYFLDQWATLNLLEELKSGKQSVDNCWFFLGFSSWGRHQLYNEIAEGAWEVAKGNMEQLDWPSR